jgi:hypothetical protein
VSVSSELVEFLVSRGAIFEDAFVAKMFGSESDSRGREMRDANVKGRVLFEQAQWPMDKWLAVFDEVRMPDTGVPQVIWQTIAGCIKIGKE